MNKKQEFAKQNAYVKTDISVEESRKLPNLLGKIVPVQLQMYGWYAHNTDKGIHYYELRK